MKTSHCTQVERLLPLHAGGDLSGREAATVDAHLAMCAACRKELAELNESRAWVTGLAAREAVAPIFNDAQLAAMRATVLSEISSQLDRPVWRWRTTLRPARWAFAALVLLLALGALVVSTRRAATPAEFVTLPPSLEETTVPEQGFVKPQLVASDRPVARARRSQDRLRHPARRPLVDWPSSTSMLAVLPDSAPLVPTGGETNPVDTAPAQEMLRIEMQTTDPNIRIIWFAPSADIGALSPPTTK